MSTIDRVTDQAFDARSAGAETTDPPRDPRPVDELYTLAYDELRRRASAVRRGDPFATISTRTLVHETWFKFSGASTPRFEDERHLIEIVVRAMRQVLVDVARYRRAARRTGIEIPVEDSIPLPSKSEDETLAIDEAISELEQLDPELASIVQLRFFGGFSVVEVGELRGLSESSVRRKLKVALARLKVSLERDE